MCIFLFLIKCALAHVCLCVCRGGVSLLFYICFFVCFVFVVCHVFCFCFVVVVVVVCVGGRGGG